MRTVSFQPILKRLSAILCPAAGLPFAEKSDLSRQHALDGADDLGGVGLGAGAEALHHGTVGREEKFLEVPLDVSGLAVGVGGLGQLGVERVAVVAVDVGLGRSGNVTP